jgi:hypothetical protein
MCIIHVFKVKCRSTLIRRPFQGILKLCCLFPAAAVRHVLHEASVTRPVSNCDLLTQFAAWLVVTCMPIYGLKWRGLCDGSFCCSAACSERHPYRILKILFNGKECEIRSQTDRQTEWRMWLPNYEFFVSTFAPTSNCQSVRMSVCATKPIFIKFDVGEICDNLSSCLALYSDRTVLWVLEGVLLKFDNGAFHWNL